MQIYHFFNRPNVLKLSAELNANDSIPFMLCIKQMIELYDSMQKQYREMDATWLLQMFFKMAESPALFRMYSYQENWFVKSRDDLIKNAPHSNKDGF